MTPISAKGLQSLIPLLAGLGTVVQVLVLLALAFASVLLGYYCPKDARTAESPA